MRGERVFFFFANVSLCIGSCQVCAYWRQCYDSHHQWTAEYGDMARYLVSGVQGCQALAEGGGYDPGREELKGGGGGKVDSRHRRMQADEASHDANE